GSSLRYSPHRVDVAPWVRGTPSVQPAPVLGGEEVRVLRVGGEQHPLTLGRWVAPIRPRHNRFPGAIAARALGDGATVDVGVGAEFLDHVDLHLDPGAAL